MHRIETLRQTQLAQITKAFRSRGRSLKRCEKCQLGEQHCICEQLKTSHSQCDLLLLMHSKELLKPSNSGRLIADTLPDNTYAYLWSRTEPEPELLDLLSQSNRKLLLVFPPRNGDSCQQVTTTEAKEKIDGKKITLILLDGTWKQARKMYTSSEWLQHIPNLVLCQQDIENTAGQYDLRQAHADNLSSTCEAAAVALNALGEKAAGQQMINNFRCFNNAYLACRANLPTQSKVNSSASK